MRISYKPRLSCGTSRAFATNRESRSAGKNCAVIADIFMIDEPSGLREGQWINALAQPNRCAWHASWQVRPYHLPSMRVAAGVRVPSVKYVFSPLKVATL